MCYGNLICNNKLIGFSSQGDNEYAVRQGLEILTDKFQRKFDILVLASLTRGKTIETPISLAKNYGYEVIVCSTYRGLELSYSSYSQMEGKNPLLGLDLNDCCKKGIENLIKNL